MKLSRKSYSSIEYHNSNTQSDTTLFYDANGNLVADADRGISVIKYNILNLPDTIQFTNGNLNSTFTIFANRYFTGQEVSLP